MRRFLRILFTGLAALSLVLFLVAASFWRSSYSVGTEVHGDCLSRTWMVGVAYGRLGTVVFPVGVSSFGLQTFRHTPPVDWMAPGRIWTKEWAWRLPGIRCATRPDDEGGGVLLVVHFAYVLPMTVALPILWATRWRRRWRAQDRVKAGRCATCGYDLRASAGRCPESGGVVDLRAGGPGSRADVGPAPGNVPG